MESKSENPEAAVQTVVVAIGSCHGDDQAAWLVAERLEQTKLPAVRVHLISQPSDVLECLHDCRRLIVVDACQSGAPPGAITRLKWPDQRVQTEHCRSSHGFGLAETLKLAETLGRLPPVVVVFGVQIEQSRPARPLSPAVQRAVPELEQQIRREMAAPP